MSTKPHPPKLLEQHVPGITALLLRLFETQLVEHMEMVTDPITTGVTADGWGTFRPGATTLTIRFAEGEEQTCRKQ